MATEPSLPLLVVHGSNYDVGYQMLFLKSIGSECQSLSGDPPFKNAHGGEGCTDLILQLEEQVILVHSEDVTPDMNKGYIVHAHIQPSDSNPREEQFVCYCDPGMLPGNTFAVNSHGIGISGNILFQKGITSKNAIARKFVNRALMSSESLDDAIKIIKTPPGIGAGFNVNLAIKEKGHRKVSFYSIEIAHSSNGSVVDVAKYKGGFSHHLNMYQRLKVDHFEDESSLHRSARFQEIPHPKNLKDMLDMISDTNHPEYPIYRSGAAPDPYATACIGAYDVLSDRLYFFKGNPKKSHYQPVAVFNTQDLTQETLTTFKP
ncbi:beta-alanyl-dopamine/carcinine hydrolase-like isoform X2 [Ptychodera flava]|uniref:beta-alanyl-dopamine/carcinine hydrolase-like isoform X2 n=1 Tax=Ptychodera flava TaxID=63121 RepID=UPI00396AA393